MFFWRSEFFMAVKLLLLVFWVMMLCGHVGWNIILEETTASSFSPEDGGGMFLLKVGTHLQVCIALQHRRPAHH
jgi:hypothetical protein